MVGARYSSGSETHLQIVSPKVPTLVVTRSALCRRQTRTKNLLHTRVRVPNVYRPAAAARDSQKGKYDGHELREGSGHRLTVMTLTGASARERTRSAGRCAHEDIGSRLRSDHDWAQRVHDPRGRWLCRGFVS